ncbi:hypothetical protein WSM22_18600 [Cytophagales bacterium WSM2-2]|nr:hypothetical protein WSM22_18600 [Cytophagales bacterium WSM2-2]
MKAFTLNIAEPCAEKWSSFTHTPKGGFCTSCQKTVIDFTEMSDAAILAFINNKPQNTCGRFRPDQLRTYSISAPPKIQPGFGLFKAAAVGLLLMLVSRPAFTQNINPKPGTEIRREEKSKVQAETLEEFTVKGVVKDETGEKMWGVNIVLKGTTVGTVSNEKGEFEFPQKLKAGDVLVFTFIGFKPEEYLVSSKNMDAVITVDIKCDVEVMGKVAVTGVYERESKFNRLWSKVKALF